MVWTNGWLFSKWLWSLTASNTDISQEKLGCFIGSNQEHSELLGGLVQQCTATVAEYESVLVKQEAEDLVEAQWIQEEEAKKVEIAKEAAEKEKKEKEEKQREMERKRDAIAAAEQVLAAQRKELLEAEKEIDESDDNDIETPSFLSENLVSFHILYFYATLICNGIRVPPKGSWSGSLMKMPGWSSNRLSIPP